MVASAKVKNPTSTPRKSTIGATHQKNQAKPNGSILSFFKKTEKPEGSLFVAADTATPVPEQHVVREDLNADSACDGTRFNEVPVPIKKRRIEDDALDKIATPAEADSSPGPEPDPTGSVKSTKTRKSGPFVDSDSEEDDDEEDYSTGSIKIPTSFGPRGAADLSAITNKPIFSITQSRSPQETRAPEEPPTTTDSETGARVPTLKHEYSSIPQMGDIEGYEDADDIDVDAFEGEETREMQFMRAQARLEAEEAGMLDEFHDESFEEESLVQSCPICEGSLKNISMEEATRHVNACLDGNPIPLPSLKEIEVVEKQENESVVKEEPGSKDELDLEEVSKRFARAAVPRPAQASPFDIGNVKKAKASSAFSKLMTSNVEDTAWATAAAAETAARGKQAYERTCPFYKIMPGFDICVDAFRYGAVKGCKAYFLSHFHSDHYIGLTSSWRHGPIYCSKVTGSLVRNQLRTAAKWVVELEFNQTVDVPDTGAKVTMIPANHCPGSSLFLFEKQVANVTKRILHCGDFRACPDHISHPLLKAEVRDAVSGKIKQQKIDQCYLDTTYLNPRYSFPPQNDVIKATAELCGSMSPDPDCKDDVWESAAKEAGTQNVSKFFQSEKQSGVAPSAEPKRERKKRLLVVCGTYSIGKERICIAIAKALGSKIFASPGKTKICKQLDNPELAALLTNDPREAQVHMQMLMEIRAETLQEYLNSYKPHFSRIVGFRPSGWTFRPLNSKPVPANTSPGSIATEHLLHGKGWKPRFGYKDFIAQRGSTREAMCFGVPYSEHSSFRELAMFIMSLRIEKVIPTVNVGSEQSRKRMKAWTDRWQAERRRGGLVVPLIEGVDVEEKPNLWDGKAGQGGGVWW